MTTFREAIEDDFQDVCDDLETVSLHARATGGLVAVCSNAKRSLRHDDREPFDSLGFAVADYVAFRIARADLPPDYRTALGDWVEDENRDRYVVTAVMDSKMTAGLRLRTVSLRQLLTTTVTILERAPKGPAGGPGLRMVPRHINVPARVWPVQQTQQEYLGDVMKPEFRCALFADGTQVRLPLPQGAAVMTTDGTVYEVSAVHGLDALGGFATLDLVQQARRAGGA